jgi:hypothetical protein
MKFMKKYLILLFAQLSINCSHFGIENFNPNFAFDAFKELEAEEDFKARQQSKECKQIKAANKAKRAELLAQVWESDDKVFDGAAIVEAEVKRLFKGLERDNVFGVLNFEDIIVPRLINKYQAQLNEAYKNGDFEKIIDLHSNFNKFKEVVINYKKQKMSSDFPHDISQSVQEYVVDPKLADMPFFISSSYSADLPFASASPRTRQKLDQLEANFEKALS